MFLRRILPRHLLSIQRRRISHVNVPFEDDLIGFEDDSLADFQHYQGPQSPPPIDQNSAPTTGTDKTIAQVPFQETFAVPQLPEISKSKNPVIFVSKLTNPYMNLAIEDYIYNAMPKPEGAKDNSFDRLMFYINTPCVVIGKNQNPWQEVNLPVLNSLGIPMLRRRSGGGTVVHDLGNVNYSYMTTKANFDRHKFASYIVEAVNRASPRFKIETNERGDIVSEKLLGLNYKISGSAYKLSKGKSYHHGTMLLKSKLDILGKLLHRDEKQLGVVDSKMSIPSVKSKVINLEMSSDQFIDVVSQKFKSLYSVASEEDKEMGEFNEMFGLTDFAKAQEVTLYVIDDATTIPEEIQKTADELKQWSWRFGHTPKFTHMFTNEKYGLEVLFNIEKGCLKSFKLTFNDSNSDSREIKKSFQYLETYIKNNDLEYTGSNVAGFVLHDEISDWIGESIDGTI
ncbi:lipoate biosynthesis protein, putative [Candida dubliniensis CD36]|uniref:Putative lipoate-protein ligase A n=1 Tax=Candida dubliniensis (strain CD36 / ATCC MYA-646 / CBS 7987 / NCPF 3949 / NRRL Y-17841) TaxID=573826 RepID=B9WIZ2_CANDC|nr:lipoate biosynthesis protein, putative [Candida dubliniensis CD36]CAX41210.1 lipoate biosynthesis protein, putative [Candida dubliniensis CD36]